MTPFEAGTGLTDKFRRPNFKQLFYRELFSRSRANFASAGDPAIRPLVFTTVDNPALLAARDEIENYFLAAIEPGSTVSFGR